MRVENRTRYPTREVQSIVRRHFHRYRPRIVIVLERRKPEDPRQGYFRYSDRSVRIWLAADPGEYPFRSSYDAPASSGFPAYSVADWREELLTTAVHEAEHVRTFERTGTAEANELEAERRAVRALERHRGRSGSRSARSWIRSVLGI